LAVYNRRRRNRPLTVGIPRLFGHYADLFVRRSRLTQWGTDLLDGPDRLELTTPYQRNFGFIFIPSADTWHGFDRRPISGVRRSLIVNYVRPEWRSRNEFAFPTRAVLA
jgi:hypothetical protein